MQGLCLYVLLSNKKSQASGFTCVKHRGRKGYRALQTYEAAPKFSIRHSHDTLLYTSPYTHGCHTRQGVSYSFTTEDFSTLQHHLGGVVCILLENKTYCDTYRVSKVILSYYTHVNSTYWVFCYMCRCTFYLL